MAKPTDRSMKSVSVNTETKEISFSGLIYNQWGHIRWLRAQLNLMEVNAEALWGTEIEAARQAVDARMDEKFKFSVIDGGKERGEIND